MDASKYSELPPSMNRSHITLSKSSNGPIPSRIRAPSKQNSTRSPNATPTPADSPSSPPPPSQPNFSGLPRPSNVSRRVSAPVSSRNNAVKSPDTPSPNPVKPRDRPRPSTPESSSTHTPANDSLSVQRHRVLSLTPPRRPTALTGISPAASTKMPMATASKTAPSIPSTSPKPPKTLTPPPNGSIKPSATPPNGRANKSTQNVSAIESPAGRPQRSRRGSNVSSLGPLPAVPWSSNGALGRLSAKLFADSPPKFTRAANEQDVDYIPPPPDSRRTSAFDISTTETHWEGQGNDEMDLEMLTEVMDGGEVDEDVSQYTQSLIMHLPFHSSKLRSTY